MFVLDGGQRGLVENPDAVLAQNVLKRLGHVGIFPAEDVRPLVDDGHLGPEPPKHLPPDRSL